MKTETSIVIFSLIVFVIAGAVYYFTQTSNSTRSTTQPTENSQSLPNFQPQTEAQKPSMNIDENKTYQAVMKTSEGDITLELNAKMTPITVNNFVTLAKKGFYNGVIFHRAVKGFMIQGGDPTGTGSGGPGYQFEDEPFEGEYNRGTLAMANAGPDTNGSQFFIMHADVPLQPDYTIFGKVISGIEVVDKIAEAPVGPNSMGEMSKPVKPAKIISVEIIEK